MSRTILTHRDSSREKIIVCIEAKADEPFDSKSVGDYWRSSLTTQSTYAHFLKSQADGSWPEGKDAARNTRAPERIKALLEILFGYKAQPNDPPWCGIKYQLLTAVAGTVIEAANKSVPLAVLIMHEFHTNSTRENLKTNSAEYERLIELLIPGSSKNCGNLHGPVRFADGYFEKRPLDLLIGKAVCSGYAY